MLRGDYLCGLSEGAAFTPAVFGELVRPAASAKKDQYVSINAQRGHMFPKVRKARVRRERCGMLELGCAGDDLAELQSIAGQPRRQ